MTGNIIGVLFFLVIIILSLINFFIKATQNNKSLSVIFVAGLAGLLFSIFPGLDSDKDYILISCGLSLAIYSFLATALFLLVFSRSKKLHVFTTAVTTLIIMVLLFGINIAQIFFLTDDFKEYKNSNMKVDAGVILGAAVWGGSKPSPVFRERINKGYELFEMKIVPKLVLTGGGSPEELAEAEVARNELVKYGVPDNCLFIDATSTSTTEQIKYVRDNLYKKFKWKKIIVISDNFHLFRSRQICLFNDINADVVATDMPLSKERVLNFCIKESVAVLFFWFFGIG